MLFNIPKDLVYEILEYLDIPHLHQVAQTCRNFYFISRKIATKKKNKIRQDKKNYLTIIVRWLRDNPKQLRFPIKDLSDPALICEFRSMVSNGFFNGYPEDLVFSFRYHYGCEYYFSHGYLAGQRCDLQSLPGKNTCAFHNHPIFDSNMLIRLGQYLDEIYQQYIC